MYLQPHDYLTDALRYLCLLAVLCSIVCNPILPTVICIEEPETGCTPMSFQSWQELLVEASTRCQIVVTTHSDILVDALSDTPEAVVICEKVNGATRNSARLDPLTISKFGWKSTAWANSGQVENLEGISIERDMFTWKVAATARR